MLWEILGGHIVAGCDNMSQKMQQYQSLIDLDQCWGCKLTVS